MKKLISVIALVFVASIQKDIVGMHIYKFHEDLFATDAVTTEYTTAEILTANPLEQDVNYLAVPWAPLINKNKLQEFEAYIEKNNFKLEGGFTVCQHIRYEKIIPILKKIGITVLFTPHVNKEYEGITVLPYPHLAIHGVDPAPVKDIFYSFIGLDTHYTRRIIFGLPQYENVIIKERKKWYFWGGSPIEEKYEYQDVLARSRFSLCPRGTGASTLRFWESLQAGAIPVLIADDMRLPAGFDWANTIIIIPEKNTADVHVILSKISSAREAELRQNSIAVYQQFSEKNLVSAIRRYYHAY